MTKDEILSQCAEAMYEDTYKRTGQQGIYTWDTIKEEGKRRWENKAKACISRYLELMLPALEKEL